MEQADHHNKVGLALKDHMTTFDPPLSLPALCIGQLRMLEVEEIVVHDIMKRLEQIGDTDILLKMAAKMAKRVDESLQSQLQRP